MYVQSLGKTTYVAWSEVISVKHYAYYTVVSVKRITFFHRLLGILLLNFHPIFTLSKTSHENYVKDLEYMKLKLPGKFK